VDAPRRAARSAITRLCASGLSPLELLRQVAERVRAAVPYVSAGWQLTDPATLLGTSGFAVDVDPGTHLQLIENELTGADFIPFTLVARSPAAALTLSTTTGGELDRSARYRTINATNGWGDELRAVFRSGGAAWGQVCLARAAGEPDFSPDDTAFLAAVCGEIGDGLRSALLLDSACSAVPGRAPGLVVLQDDGSVEAMSDDAVHWLAELPDEGLELPPVVYEVARRARSLADTGRPGLPARARVRVPSQHWLVLHGARLRPVASGHPTTAVVVEQAHHAELVPLIVAAHELTPREREVTEMLVRGLSTAEIAATLWLSPYTVRDHVKAVFGKLGVRSRPELTAMLFHEHYAAGCPGGSGDPESGSLRRWGLPRPG
jgi:DNA-binding CsgD family transcriptional regulator